MPPRTQAANTSALLDKVAGMQRRAMESKTATPAPAKQLPVWEEDERGLPNSFARGALFTAAKHGRGTLKREFFEGKVIASLGGLHIEYQGQELRQDDASVFMTLLHLGRHQKLGDPIHFTAYSMLKELGWSINSDEYEHLRECCKRLNATSVTVATPNEAGSEGYNGSMLRSFRWKDEKGKQLSQWYVLLEPTIAQLFCANTFSLLQWGERKAIGGRSPLALWCHSYLSTHREPKPMSVVKYYELSASRSKDLSDFRSRLKAALQKLIDIGFLKSYVLRNDVVYVIRHPKKFKNPMVSLELPLVTEEPLV
ncbi:plasmid replication initiator TrfA [Burkholderia cenocepacia]|uniref:plasmid replication initiator TrfA n=1 Tax=Burkholderia cenocepacia TaxID=95486 RepID=UPI000761155C|nr:plasmid replication initiator TrfA [Burkholderia cenocepacia]KWU26406.1 hypothetical protein AS149_25805 [Burkholderia cenocepacia]